MSNNDLKILELKKEIEIKKNELQKKDKVSYITNLMINVGALNGIPASSSPTKNLNTLNEEELKSLLVYLSLFKKESDELQLGELQLHGFNLSDYISDIKSKLDEIKYKYKIKQLKEMEDKLEKLLSDDKRKELELDSLNDLLKSM